MYSSICAVPHVLDSRIENDNPVLVSSYVPHTETLAEALTERPAGTSSSALVNSARFIHAVNKRTNSRYAVPADLQQKLRDYSSKFEGSLEEGLYGRVQALADGLSRTPIAKTHGDLKPLNILLGDKDGSAAVIDWEHYNDRSESYDIATLYGNTSLLLHANGKLHEAVGIASALEPYMGASAEMFYANLAGRTLVEFSPAVGRGEYGDPARVVPYLNGMLHASLDAVERPVPLSRFSATLVDRYAGLAERR